jgi:transketolase N-terminal domain/subunit
LDFKNKSSIPVISTYNEEMSINDLKRLALQLRRDVAEITYYLGTKSSRIGGELSAADIMAVL